MKLEVSSTIRKREMSQKGTGVPVGKRVSADVPAWRYRSALLDSYNRLLHSAMRCRPVYVVDAPHVKTLPQVSAV